MSLEVLKTSNNPQIHQMPKHDLESVFYILLFFCTMFTGPGDQEKKQNSTTANIPLAKWLIPGTELDTLFSKKFADISFFDDNVMPHIDPYFSDIKGCLMELYDVMFPPTAGHSRQLRQLDACMASHERVIDVLQRTLDSLPDDKPPSGPPTRAPDEQALSKPGPLSAEPGPSQPFIAPTAMKRTVSERDTQMPKSSSSVPTPSPQAMKPLPVRTRSTAASIASSRHCSDSGFFSVHSEEGSGRDSGGGSSKRIRSGNS